MRTMITDFEGKVAVVTGAANGIGRSLVLAFAKRGMKIVLADIDKEALDNVEQELKEIGTEVLVQVTDVSKREQIEKLANASYDHFGHVNILCNNAGITQSVPLQYLSLEDWDWVLDVNLCGVIYGVHFFVKRMVESNIPCHIVNTSSLAGLLSGILVPYSVTKHAVVALSEYLFRTLKDTNVGVSVLCPGYVRTELMENTEKLSKQRSGASLFTKDKLRSMNVDVEAIEKDFETGMDPDIVAEKVIKAIEEDIFYIVTHPEFVPYIQNRFERIKEDSKKLN